MRMLNMINLLLCKCQYTCYASIKFLGVIKYLICMLFDSIIWLILDITMNTVHIFTKKQKQNKKNREILTGEMESRRMVLLRCLRLKIHVYIHRLVF